MNLHTIIDVAMLITVIAQAIAYRRLVHEHTRVLGALWASTLDRSQS